MYRYQEQYLYYLAKHTHIWANTHTYIYTHTGRNTTIISCLGDHVSQALSPSTRHLGALDPPHNVAHYAFPSALCCYMSILIFVAVNPITMISETTAVGVLVRLTSHPGCVAEEGGPCVGGRGWISRFS